MSVINIELSKTKGTKGIEKTIDENALTLILDNLQISQYSHPEASTVRELASNGIDSQKEKEISIKILKGEAKIEDYYIKRDDVKYKDSNFDISYYDLKYLDEVNNYVLIQYIKGKESFGFCDSLVFQDWGVGIGRNRLYGALQVGFSTKRNTVNQIGGWGLGAKASLSMRNDYYNLESCHQGKLVKFQCYSYKVDSLIPKFNIKENKENDFIVFPNGDKVYYENSNSKNYTKITVPCKRYHFEKIKQAVNSQLIYFNNIKFKITEDDGREWEDNFQAKIYYNSENLLIAEQFSYSKPHVLIVKDRKSTECINYGYVSFKELELQELYGACGFKANQRQVVRNKDGSETVIQEGVDLLPNREGIVWSDATRDYIKKIIAAANIEATELISKELKEDDFLLWLQKTANIIANTGYGSGNTGKVLNVLGKIIDKNSIEPTYHLDKSIKYVNPETFFWGLNVRTNHKSRNYKLNKDEINRNIVDSWYGFNCDHVYIQEEETSFIKDLYLCENFSTFVTIKVIPKEELIEKYVEEQGEIIDGKPKFSKWTEDYVNKLIDKRDKVLNYIKKSSLCKYYKDVIVPEDYNKKHEETVKEIEKQELAIKYTPKELRQLEERTIIHTLKQDSNRKDRLPFTWKKGEPKISDLKDSEDNIVYGFGEDDEKLQITAVILWKMFNGQINSKELNLIKVSKSMPKKFLRKHTYIGDFYGNLLIDKEVTMSQELVKWNTARVIYNNLESLKFMRNYELFNSEVYNTYKEVKEYCHRYYKDTDNITSKYSSGAEFINNTIRYCNKVAELQVYIREHKDKSDLIQKKSEELFGINTVETAIGLDLQIYDKLQLLINYTEPVKSLFNHITVLYDESKAKDITFETEQLIKEVIELKGLTQFNINQNLLNNEKNSNNSEEVNQDFNQEVSKEDNKEEVVEIIA